VVYRDSVPKLHDPDDGKHVAVAVSETGRLDGFDRCRSSTTYGPR